MANNDDVPFIPEQYNRRSIGSARLVPQEKLEKQGYRAGDFWLGRTVERGRAFGWTDEFNLLTCSGPGGGKSVSSVVPNLLTFPGSAVVVDPKGELATLTASYRREILGQKVLVLDPTRAAKVSENLRGTYNPFDELYLDDPGTVRAAQTIASGIVVPNPKSKDPFWDQNAHDFIQSCILYMIRHYPPDGRTLMKLRETVSLGDQNLFNSWVEQKRASEGQNFSGTPADAFDLFQQALFETTEFGGIVRETAAKIGRMGDRTLGDVLSAASTHLDFLKTPELWESLVSNPDPAKTFRLSELRRQDRPLTIYLCLPIDMIPHQGRWFRLIISLIINYIERSDFNKEKDRPILLMLDEFANLGQMPSIVNSLTYSRSFGLRLWIIIQSLTQLKDKYPESWETILGMCSIKQFFSINDLFTAKYVSELIGDEEIDVPSISLTKTFSDTASKSGSKTNTASTTDTHGTNRSSTSGTSGSHTQGFSSSTSYGTTETTSTGSSTSQGNSWGSSGGTSQGTSQGTNSGKNTGENFSGFNPTATSRSTGQSTGTSQGTNSGSNSGWNTGWNAGSSQSTGRSSSINSSATYSASESHTSGWSQSETIGTSESRSFGNSQADTRGWGSSASSGANYSFTVSKQKRRRFTPDEIMLSFTKNNLAQLVHVRDHGGFLLLRTPFFADPHFRTLLQVNEESKSTLRKP